MSRFTANIGYSLGGVQYGQSANVIGSSPINVIKENFPAALVAVLQTRTDDDTGVLRFTGTDPAIAVGNRLDVYWDVGGGGIRRAMKASSISGAGPWDVTVGTAGGDIGIGDIFPAAATPLTVGKVQSFDFRFDGDDIVGMVVDAKAKAVIVIASGADTEEKAYVFKSANQSDAWYSGNGITNPIAGDVITKVFMSHGDSTSTRELKAGVLLL